MEKNCCYLNIVWLLLSLNGALQSTKSEMNYAPPATNISARMANMFRVILKWEAATANCTPEYRVMISSRNSSKVIQKVTRRTYLLLNIFDIYHRLDPNDYFSTAIQVNWKGVTSEWAKETHMQLASGNERTSVKSVSCVWHYMEYINCTWQPGVDTLTDVQYRLLYWEKDTYSGTLPESAQLQDLLGTGTECQDYFPLNGMYLGCILKYEYRILDYKELLFVVTDTSYSAKPFLYYTRANDIGKLKIPIISYVSEVINNHMYINWTVTPPYNDLISEVLVFTDRWRKPFKVTNAFQVKISIPNSDDTMRVKVRVKFSEYICDSLLWSDWSKEWTVPGKDKNKTSILLFTLIPAAVVVVVVILLVYLKRLKMLFFPIIPHPRKMFQKDLQNWLNSERAASVYKEPEMEDISPVSLLEI